MNQIGDISAGVALPNGQTILISGKKASNFQNLTTLSSKKEECSIISLDAVSASTVTPSGQTIFDNPKLSDGDGLFFVTLNRAVNAKGFTETTSLITSTQSILVSKNSKPKAPLKIKNQCSQKMNK